MNREGLRPYWAGCAATASLMGMAKDAKTSGGLSLLPFVAFAVIRAFAFHTVREMMAAELKQMGETGEPLLPDI